MDSFFEYSLNELEALFKEKSLPSYRLKQLTEWVYQKKCTDLNQMTNLPLALRGELGSLFALPLLKLKQHHLSQDLETIKYLWELPDGKLVESVLIMSDNRRTVCVSSQVGCPARCAFCASGKEGLKRNLTAGEIVEQIYLIDSLLKEKGERVSHIVFMGMGEPLENYDAVVKAIENLIHPELFGFSHRRITVSTVGVIEGIEKLAHSGLKVNLVLSLHAPNQRIRQKIIPYARRYELDDVLKAMDYYSEKTKRDITFEYTLLRGINDAPDHALELADLLKERQCTVNLIPYNPVTGLKLQRPETEAIWEFRKILDQKKINNTCRYTKGDDIAAACGQLALITQEV